jgi:hypothetical protein
MDSFLATDDRATAYRRQWAICCVGLDRDPIVVCPSPQTPSPAGVGPALARIDRACEWELNRRRGFDHPLQPPEAAIPAEEGAVSTVAATAIQATFAQYRRPAHTRRSDDHGVLQNSGANAVCAGRHQPRGTPTISKIAYRCRKFLQRVCDSAKNPSAALCKTAGYGCGAHHACGAATSGAVRQELPLPDRAPSGAAGAKSMEGAT